MVIGRILVYFQRLPTFYVLGAECFAFDLDDIHLQQYPSDFHQQTLELLARPKTQLQALDSEDSQRKKHHPNYFLTVRTMFEGSNVPIKFPFNP